jgi:hypothetical protein
VQFLGQDTSLLMKILGIDSLTPDEIDAKLAAGGRFVYYDYCISFVFVTLRRPSSIFFLRPGERGVVRGLPYVLLSAVLGWWGLPWGLVYTPAAIFLDLGGGHDVTSEVRQFLDATMAEVGPKPADAEEASCDANGRC